MAKATQVDFLLAGVCDNSGNVLSNGQVFFFETGSGYSTPKSTWTDPDKVTANSHPVTLSSGGTSNIYADGIYDIQIKDSAGTLVRQFSKLTFDTQTHTELHNGTFFVGTTTGPANTYSATISEYKGSGSSKALVVLTFNVTNTGSSTLSVNSGAASGTIYKAGGVTLSAGDIQAGSIKLLLHDGATGFFLVS